MAKKANKPTHVGRDTYLVELKRRDAVMWDRTVRGIAASVTEAEQKAIDWAVSDGESRASVYVESVSRAGVLDF